MPIHYNAFLELFDEINMFNSCFTTTIKNKNKVYSKRCLLTHNVEIGSTKKNCQFL